MARNLIEPGLRVGRILGIPIQLHPTWFVVFVLVLLVLWNQLARLHPDTSLLVRGGAAVLTAGLVFVSILLHELGHSVLALRHGVRVRSIVLFVFGGVAWMENPSRSPRAEFQIALAGPASSAALALLFAGAGQLAAPDSLAGGLLRYLAFVNAAVALFNLLPGFPLDGGRVLRAMLWAAGRDPSRATAWAAAVGQAIAYGLVALGAVLAFEAPIPGLWLAFMGWFVLTASIGHRRRAGIELTLRGLCARDLMTPNVPTIDAGASVARFAEDHVLRGDRWAIVLAGGAPKGLVSRTDLKRVPRARWESVDVGGIATPMEKIIMASPDLAAADLLPLFAQRRNNQIPIMDGDRITGAVTRKDLLQAIETGRTEADDDGRAAPAAGGGGP